MRMAGRPVTAHVSLALDDGTPRPVRLTIGGIAYRMHPDEAIGIANQLADAVESIPHTERNTEQ